MQHKTTDTTLETKTLQKVIINLLPSCHPNLNQAARIIGLPPRTLQRRLKNIGKTYSQLLDEARQIEAFKLLEHRDLRLYQVAKQLGYTDAGSFTRAFVRWNGITPKLYKNHSKES